MQESHVLYRKYRPTDFSQVLGQDQIVKILEKAVKSTPNHAYIFSGTRGTGKTTLARIFARELGTEPIDIYEIDAASHNGVDYIRDLREEVSTLPVMSKYKVYILDEVHMLSTSAFNALLKTIEEPPRHAIFILATTELHKVPKTIVSRCQVLQLSSPSESLLKDFVIDITTREGYTIDPEGAELVAMLGDRSFRDTHGVLQKIIELSTKKQITTEFVESVTGTPSYKISEKYIEALLSGNIDEVMIDLNTISKNSNSINLFFKRTISLFRFILMTRFSKVFVDSLKNTSVIEKDFATKTIKQYPTEINSAKLLLLLSWYEKSKIFPDESLALEMVLVENKERILSDSEKVK